MKKIILLIMALGLLTACSSNDTSEEAGEEESQVSTEANSQEEEPEEEGQLSVSAAASLTDVISELAENYEDEKKVSFDLNFASSGALQSQIEEGAKVDIFISAAKKQMDALIDEDLVAEEESRDLLKNDVVLISPKGSDKNIESIEDLNTDKVSLVALGEPTSVPVGQYSQEILDYYGMTEEVNDKTSYASDVRQVLNWVATGEADAGFVYKTDAMIEDGVEIIEASPEESHKPVIYPAGLIKESENKDLAEDFLDYLASDEAREVFEDYGFSVID